MGNSFHEDTKLASVQHDLVTLFEKAVHVNPDACALEQDGMRLTYQSLDELSGHFAFFISQKTYTGDIVCVHADGSINWIVAIYGILKAGRVYCALSNKIPPEIREENHKTAAATMFLVSHSQDVHLNPVSCSTCFSIEDILAAEPKHPCNHRAQPIPWTDAYICFTSGSTGKPKGVVCTYAGLVAFQRDPKVRLWAEPGIRISQLMSPAFDGNIHQIFSALSYGATLVLGCSDGNLNHLYTVDSILCTPSIAKELCPTDFPRFQ